jgi:hypothetical protein
MPTPHTRHFERALNSYRTFDRLITNRKVCGYGLDKIQELEEMRDEAFRAIQIHTREHEDAFLQLKQELNLYTNDEAR